VHASLDDLVIALYVTIDELLAPCRGPGRPPKLADSELICLAVAQVLLGYRSERRWLRAVHTRLGHLFPYVLGQAAYNRRLRRSAPLVATLSQALALACPSWCDQWRLLDATPVPCGASRETVRRSDLAGWAGYGHERSHSRWSWGLKQYVLACPDGLPVAWCLASPRDGEREVAEVLVDRAARQQAQRPGMVVLANKGLVGQAFEQVVADLGARLVRPDRKDEPAEWSPFVRRRRRAIDQRALDRRTARLLAQPRDHKLAAPTLGIALDGDLASWRQGRYVIPPAQLRGKAMAVVGAPGGETVTLLRLALTAPDMPPVASHE
jgi:hypothetical protein